MSPRNVLIAVAAGIVLMAAGAGLFALVSGGDDSTGAGPSSQAQAQTATPAPATPTPVPPTATPVPPPPPPPEPEARTNCNEIRATGYQNDAERAFFLANCVSSQAAAGPSQAAAQATAPRPAPAAPSGPTPQADSFTFNVDAGVSAADEAAIREGLDLGQRFFRDIFGKSVSGAITVRITAVAGSNPAFAGASMLTFNTAHQVWTSTASVNRHKIAIHELFHIFQSQNGFLAGNPRWFVEGSAEYVGYQAISYGGLFPYEIGRHCQMFSMAHGVEPSLTLRDGGIPPSSGYWLAFMGIDYMSSSNARTFATIVNYPAAGWGAKLTGVLGLSAEEFYNRFEAERQRYQIPSNYECPR